MKIAAPISGTLVRQADLSDQVFVSGMLGPGVGIVPTDSVVCAPVSGQVSAAFKTGHAFVITTEGGLQVLIHIGVDTVTMKGDGFQAHVRAGDSVTRGERLATVDFDKVRDARLDPTTIIVVMNSEGSASVVPVDCGSVQTGDPIIDVTYDN